MTRQEILGALLGALLIGTPGGTAAGQTPRPRPPERPILIAHEIIRTGALERGLVTTLATMMRDDGVLVWPGMPVVTTSPRISSALEAQGYPLGLTFQLQPLGLRVAIDSSMVLAFGVAYWAEPDSVRGSLGRYMMAWHRRPDGWSLGAFGLMEMPTFPAVTLPDSLVPGVGEALLEVGDADASAFVMADLAFADSASRSSAAIAFGSWAAPSAVMFGPAGVLLRGPEAIAEALRSMDGSGWSWRPVATGASDDGSLGWTAGEAGIAIPGAGGGPGRLLKSTYLTFWERRPDGSVRFIVDGGNIHP